MPEPHPLNTLNIRHLIHHPLQPGQSPRLRRHRHFTRLRATLDLGPLLALLLLHDAAQRLRSAAPAGGVEEAEDGGGRPVDGSRPVGDEQQDADGDDVVAADAVVRIGQVDARDGVGVAEGEKGRVREQQRRQRVLRRRRVELGEEVLLHAEEEKERDIGGARLREQDESEEVVQGVDDETCLSG